MRRAHDVGGMEGLGPLTPDAGEYGFHADFERRMFGITMCAIGKGLVTSVDEFRWGVEQLAPEEYFASNYYERWISPIERALFDRGQLAEAAKLWVGRGFKRLKMTVGHNGLARRDVKPLMDLIREDEARVRAVREAVGPGVELFIDANCSLDLYHAQKLAEMIKPYGISFFEEPLTQNDAGQMAQLRRQSGMALACGQNEGLAFRFRDLLVREAIDYAQPNVVITGGYTQCLRIAGMAAAFNVPISNGGGHAPHNAHLQAGAINGSMIECHVGGFGAYDRMYEGLPTIKDGWLELTDAPGFGLVPDLDRIKSAQAKG